MRMPRKKSPRKRSSRKGPIRSDLLIFERSLLSKGVNYIGGVDEVGRGCLAGPVFAAAVILPSFVVIPGVNDSKLLTPSQRERLYGEICSKAIAWAVASVDAEEIDRINIHRASLRAMQLAVNQLKKMPEFLLIDGRFSIPMKLAQMPIIKGDQKSHTIAAASILAKVSRDRWITEEGGKYPGFNFRQHKGYGTREHFEEIRKNGLTPLHRRSFRHL